MSCNEGGEAWLRPFYEEIALLHQCDMRIRISPR